MGRWDAFGLPNESICSCQGATLIYVNWRQFTASITKEKFSIKERTNFNLKDGVGEDIEDELDLVVLAKLSNYTFYTFNYTYTKTTTLTINTLLHRNYRVSES